MMYLAKKCLEHQIVFLNKHISILPTSLTI